VSVQDAAGTTVDLGEFSVVRDGAIVGAGCRIGSHVLIERGARIGDGVTIQSGTQVWDGVTLGDRVFVGPNATFVNDPFPRSRSVPIAPRTIVVRDRASIGANATLLPGIQVGEGAMVGAGAVVTRSVPRDAIVVGNPARIVGYVETGRDAVLRPLRPVVEAPSVDGTAITGVRGVTFYERPVIRDLRGSLVAGEVDQGLPFAPQRYFMVFDVPGADVRGEHAHRACHQLLICVSGEVHVVADDGEHRQEFVLDHQGRALHLPPMTWGIQYRYAPGTTLLVLASHAYDAADYIRDYDEFLREVAAN
jgi:UDP-2-acetamido-3-amino-2,3-dideoxy-glucuronate N-acetyltransferase